MTRAEELLESCRAQNERLIAENKALRADRPDGRAGIFAEIDAERARQDAKWGPVKRGPWVATGVEKLSATKRCWVYDLPNEEVAKCTCELEREVMGDPSFAAFTIEELVEVVSAGDEVSMRAELVQLAACAVKWLEAIDLKDGAR